MTKLKAERVQSLINGKSDICIKLKKLSSLCRAELLTVGKLINEGNGFLEVQGISRLSQFILGIYQQILDCKEKWLSPDFDLNYQPTVSLRAPDFERIAEYLERHNEGTAPPDEPYFDNEYEVEIRSLLQEYSEYCEELARFLEATNGNFENHDGAPATPKDSESNDKLTCIFNKDFHACKILDNKGTEIKAVKFYFRIGSEERRMALKLLHEKNQNPEEEKRGITAECLGKNKSIHSLFTKDMSIGKRKQVLEFYEDFIEAFTIDNDSRKKYRLKIPSKVE